MAEVGAWRNFGDLEDNLTLEELLELFDIAQERQNRLLKTIAAAFGADISEDEPRDKSKVPSGHVDEQGNYVPGMINSEQDAMNVNSIIGGAGGLIGFHSRLDD